MKVCISTAHKAGSYHEILNLDTIEKQERPALSLSHNKNMVFRISEYNPRTGKCKDDGSGNEASWWSIYIGTAEDILELVEKDKGSFPAHDERILKPALEAERNIATEAVCWLYCIPKPKIRYSGRFMGPDRQPWADDEALSKLFRWALNLPDDMPIVFVGGK